MEKRFGVFCGEILVTSFYSLEEANAYIDSRKIKEATIKMCVIEIRHAHLCFQSNWESIN
jgi:hypothetical protein